VKRCVRIYVEGGATGKTADSDFRRGWKKFMNELHELARANDFHSLEVVRGKGRGNAFSRFKMHNKEHPNDLCVLLVDAETAVPEDARVWSIVANREGDNWQCPLGQQRGTYILWCILSRRGYSPIKMHFKSSSKKVLTQDLFPRRI
jgi:hypothetical protein